MIEIFCTFIGTFFGAVLAFLFNAIYERKKELKHQKSILYETLETIKSQISYFKHIESIYTQNYEKDKIPFYMTKDNIVIEQFVERDTLDWLIYGKLMEFFSMSEVNLEKIIFLVNKKHDGGYSLLKKIRGASAGYQQIINLIKEREKKFNELDLLCSENIKDDIFNTISLKNKFNDLLMLGKAITTKLMKELKESRSEFSEYANELDDYIKNQYINCCCFKKYLCSN